MGRKVHFRVATTTKKRWAETEVLSKCVNNVVLAQTASPPPSPSRVCGIHRTNKDLRCTKPILGKPCNNVAIYAYKSKVMHTPRGFPKYLCTLHKPTLPVTKNVTTQMWQNIMTLKYDRIIRDEKVRKTGAKECSLCQTKAKYECVFRMKIEN